MTWLEGLKLSINISVALRIASHCLWYYFNVYGVFACVIEQLHWQILHCLGRSMRSSSLKWDHCFLFVLYTLMYPHH